MALDGPFSGQQNFLQLFDHYEVIETIILDSNMQNQRILMHFEQEYDQKPKFGPFLAINGPFSGQQNFFQLFDHYEIIETIILDSNIQNQRILIHLSHHPFKSCRPVVPSPI